MLNKILILSPHMDDEVLGCGGLISKTNKDNLHIHYFNKKHATVDDKIYSEENGKLLDAVGCACSFSNKFVVNRLDEVPILKIIYEIENLINILKPDTLLIPYPSYNQDHRKIYQASLTAARPHDVNFFVKKILIYEQPETQQSIGVCSGFKPLVFTPIDIEKKIELYSYYKSQVREHRSIKAIKSLAYLRGSQSNCEYAEAFQVLRWVL